MLSKLYIGMESRLTFTDHSRTLHLLLLFICVCRDSNFITLPLFVYRMNESIVSGGLYASALLSGSILAFIVMGVLLDHLGWVRVVAAAAGGLSFCVAILAMTALGLVPYLQALDVFLIAAVFFFSGALYLAPDILINKYLPEGDRGSAHVKSASLYPALSLILTSIILFFLEHLIGDMALGVLLVLAAGGTLVVLSAVFRVESFLGSGMLLMGRGGEHGARPLAEDMTNEPRGILAGLNKIITEFHSGFRFIIFEKALRPVFAFNCALALAISPHNVFITPVLKSFFALDDGEVAVAQFALAVTEMAAAYALPNILRTRSLQVVGGMAVGTLVLGNALGGAAVVGHTLDPNGAGYLVPLYVVAHMSVLVGLTCALAWIRIVRGQRTPLLLLGRTAGAMSALGQLCGLCFSTCVTLVGTAIAPYAFYIACTLVMALVGSSAIRLPLQDTPKR
jgi:hypothetical protein